MEPSDQTPSDGPDNPPPAPVNGTHPTDAPDGPSETAPGKGADIHPEATFGDLEDCPSLPVVTEVTSLANMPGNEPMDTTTETEIEENEHENEEIEDMLIPHTEREFPEEHDVPEEGQAAQEAAPEPQEPEPQHRESSAEVSMESCEVCHILIPVSMVVDHMRIHQKLYEPLPCPKSKCTNEFATAFDLKNHILSRHPGTKEQIPYIYTCGTCHKEVTTLSAFHVHSKHRHPHARVTGTKELVLTCTKEGEFVCPVCVKTFQTRKMIVNHFNDIHQLGVRAVAAIEFGTDDMVDEESPMDSETSSLSSQPTPSRRESARISARAQREPSPTQMSSSMLRGALAGLDIPLMAQGAMAGQVPANPDDEPIVCPSCNEVYYDMAAFKRHYYRHTVRYTCRVCNKKIMGMAEYREHCTMHISRPRAPGEVKRTCPYCGKSFIDMKVHLRKHESSCEICGLQFVHLNNMNRHYLDVHGIDLNQFSKMPDGPDGRKMNTSLDVKLDGYHKTLESIERFEAEANVGLESTVSVKNEPVDITCEFCALTFPSQEYYNQHVITHNQKCKLCQVLIEHEENIHPHLRTVHGINDINDVSTLFEQTIVADQAAQTSMYQTQHQQILAQQQKQQQQQVHAELQRKNQEKLQMAQQLEHEKRQQALKRESLGENEPASKKAKRDMQGRAECKICYRKVIDLQAHMTTHNIKCSLCDYVSIHRFNLRPHMRQAHGLNDDEIDALIEDIIANPVQVWDIPPENRIHNRPNAPSSSKTPDSVSPANTSPSPAPTNKVNCKLCTKQFAPALLKNHMQSAHNVKCGRCGKFFLHQASMYSHMKTFHNIVDYDQVRRETISCQLNESDEEDVSSAASPALEDSEPDAPPPRAMPIPKPKPKLKSPSPAPIPTPKAAPSGSKTKKCKVCKQVVDDIKTHMNTHYKPCPLCETQFHPQGFRIHVKQKHGITDPAAIKSLEEDSSDEEEEEPDETSSLKEEPEEKDMTPEPDSLPSPIPRELPKSVASTSTPIMSRSPSAAPIHAKCKYCNKMTRDLHLHMSTRHDLKCLLCSVVIRHYGNATKHMTNMHGIENPNVHELTQSMYLLEQQADQVDPHGPLEVSNSVLDLSQENMSMEESTRVPCEFCEATFKSRKYYAQHCRNVHKIKLPDRRKVRAGDQSGSREESEDEGKEFFLESCNVCGNKFTERQHLIRHLMMEHGDNSDIGARLLSQYQSPRPSRDDSAGSHVDTDEEDPSYRKFGVPDEAKIYGCDKCTQRFSQRRYLWRHFKVHHGEQDAYARYLREGKVTDQNDTDPRPTALETQPKPVEPKPAAEEAAMVLNYDAESEILSGVNTKSEITRRRRMLAKHKESLRVVGGLGFGKFRCTHCMRRFSTTSSLHRHLKHNSCPVLLIKRQRRQSNPTAYPPVDERVRIEKVSPEEDGLPIVDSKRSNSEFRCSICKIYLSSAVSLKRHLYTHTDERPIKCFLCNVFKGFNQNVHLRAHLARYHEIPMEKSRNVGIENESIQFQLLGRYNPKGINRMELKNSGQTKCLVCNQGFTDALKLRDHMTVHGSIQPFPCGICKRGYENEAQLRAHQIRVHSMSQAKSVIVAGEFSNNKQANVFDDLAKQNDIPDSDMDEDLPETMSNLECRDCKMPIRNVDDQMEHYQYHKGHKGGDKNYCYVCWGRFSNVRNLARHFLSKHCSSTHGTATRHCRICNIDVVNLPQHLTQSHPDYNPDLRNCKCHICGKSFNSVTHRKTHVLVIHRVALPNRRPPPEYRKAVKPRKPASVAGKLVQTSMMPNIPDRRGEPSATEKNWCNICQKAYINPKAHKAAHAGGPTYECELCGRIYSNMYGLRRHSINCRRRFGETSSSPSTVLESPMDTDSNELALEPEVKAPIKPRLPKEDDGTSSSNEPSANDRYMQDPDFGPKKSGGYCKYCPCFIRFKLALHIRTVHKHRAKPEHRCTICNRHFLRSINTIKHMGAEHGLKMKDILSMGTSAKNPPATVPLALEEEEEDSSRPASRQSTKSDDDVQVMDVRVMLQRMDRREKPLVKEEPEIKEEPEWEDGSDAAPVNDATIRQPESAARPTSRDGRPNIFEVIIPDDVATKRKRNSELGESRYVKCSHCATYLQTRKSDDQLAQFRLLCNACLNVDTTKLRTPDSADDGSLPTDDPATPVHVPGLKPGTKTARKSTSGRQYIEVARAAAGGVKAKKPPKEYVPASTFVPKPKSRKKATAKCNKCGLKFLTPQALSSHERMLHVGPFRLREGITITNEASRCEFCGSTNFPGKKMAHLRKFHHELFMNGEELLPQGGDAKPMDVAIAEYPNGVEPDEPSFVESEDPSLAGTERDAEDVEEPPELEYQGGPHSAPLRSPQDEAPAITGSPPPVINHTSIDFASPPKAPEPSEPQTKKIQVETMDCDPGVNPAAELQGKEVPVLEEEQEEPTLEQEEPPLEQEDPPLEREEPTLEQEEPPIEQEEPPIEQETSPLETEDPPPEQEEAPLEQEDPNLEAEEPPLEEEDPPVDEAILGKERPPLEEEEPLLEDEDALDPDEPMEDEEPPLEEEEPALEDEEPPLEEEDSDDESDDEGPVECSDCGKRFGTPRSLSVHERIHRGLTPYSCGQCSEQFYCKRMARGHMADFHP